MIAATALALALLVGAEPAADGPASRPRLATDGRAVELALDPASIERLEGEPPTSEAWGAGFTTFVAGSEVPILGRHEREGQVLRFRPRYPFRPGTRLIVRFDPSHLGLPGAAATWPLEVPSRASVASPRVLAVHPTVAELPANSLRFYLHFSTPMSRGRAYDSIHLIDEETGREDVHAFLRLGEELWDPTGTRLTLLLDPGRIKQGLVPHEELGPVLREGCGYRLVISGAWPDADGAPLGADFEHRFRATARDDDPPDPDRWSILAPSPLTRERLSVRFDGPLDHALARRLIQARPVGGTPVRGQVELTDDNLTWSFTPETNWETGDYILTVGADLEDACGNRIGQRFEVEGSGPNVPRVESQVVARSFSIR